MSVIFILLLFFYFLPAEPYIDEVFDECTLQEFPEVFTVKIRLPPRPSLLFISENSSKFIANFNASFRQPG